MLWNGLLLEQLISVSKPTFSGELGLMAFLVWVAVGGIKAMSMVYAMV